MIENTYQLVALVIFTWGAGFLSAAALFYPIGRRHGIDALAKHWKESIKERYDD